MPSVFTIQGTKTPKAPKRRRRSRKKKGLSGADCQIGECKGFYNPRTKRHGETCCVGKDESRSGWKITKG